MAPGSVIVYYTTDGRYGKMEVVNFEALRMVASFPLPTFRYNILTVNLITFGADGIAQTTVVNGLEIDGDHYVNLDTGVVTSIGADFYWQGTSTVRYLVSTNGARFAKWK